MTQIEGVVRHVINIRFKSEGDPSVEKRDENKNDAECPYAC
jgi:hypothetical protein